MIHTRLPYDEVIKDGKGISSFILVPVAIFIIPLGWMICGVLMNFSDFDQVFLHRIVLFPSISYNLLM